MNNTKNIQHYNIDFHASSLENEVGFLFSNTDSPAHVHEGFAEFSLITAGEWEHIFDGTTRRLKKTA